MKFASITFEPLLKKQRLAASCNHASAVEMHERRHESFLQFWRQVEVELYLEVVDTRVCNCLHGFFDPISSGIANGLKYRWLAERVHGWDSGDLNVPYSVSARAVKC